MRLTHRLVLSRAIPDGAAAKEKIAPGSVLKFENVPELPKE